MSNKSKCPTCGKAMTSLDGKSWKEIAETKNPSKVFAIGDTKSVELITGEIIEFAIADFGKDKRPDGKKAGITFIAQNLLDARLEMHPHDDNSCNWEKSRMRTVYMERIMRLLPAEVQEVICPVIKTTKGVDTTDKLWLPSQSEMTGDTTYSAKGEGDQYELYKCKKNFAIEREGDQYSWFWFRSPCTGSSASFRGIFTLGSVSGSIASIAGGVRLGFCV